MIRLAALVLFSALISSCGVVEVKESDSLTFSEHMRLGAIYEAQGDYELAIREYGSAQEIDTKDAFAYFALGNVYLRTGDFQRSERNYRKAIGLRAAPEFHNNLAWLLMEKGDIEGARGSAGEAVRTAPPGSGYVYLDTLGVVQMRAGEFEAAEGSLLEAADGVPEKDGKALAEIYSHLLELYKKSGQDGKAAVAEEKLKLFRPPGERQGL